MTAREDLREAVGSFTWDSVGTVMFRQFATDLLLTGRAVMPDGEVVDLFPPPRQIFVVADTLLWVDPEMKMPSLGESILALVSPREPPHINSYVVLKHSESGWRNHWTCVSLPSNWRVLRWAALPW